MPFIIKRVEKTSYEKVVKSKTYQRQPERDRVLLEQGGEEIWNDGIATAKEAIRHDEWVKWHWQDTALIQNYWSFELEAVEHENLMLWYGGSDRTTPPELGRKIAERLPKTELRILEGETHGSMLLSFETIIRGLVGGAA